MLPYYYYHNTFVQGKILQTVLVIPFLTLSSDAHGATEGSLLSGAEEMCWLLFSLLLGNHNFKAVDWQWSVCVCASGGH